MTMSSLAIYNDFRRLITPIALREVIVAHEEMKCTRQSFREWCIALGVAEDINALGTEVKDWLTIEGWQLLESTIRGYGFGFAIGTRRVSNSIDQGKGGWSNLVRTSDIASVNDDTYLYLAPNDEVANSFRTADECGDDCDMAHYLGIPKCCAEFFSVVWPAASRRQGDLCPYSCAMSQDYTYPWDWHTNIVSQYFGGSLISFFPCSFQCPNARRRGEKTFKILSRINRGWAKSVKAISKGIFIYTEYGGVHRWSQYTLNGKQVILSGKVQSTVCDHSMSNAHIIEYSSPHDMIVHTDSQILHLSGADVALFIF
jgi:hypothetical protein